VKTICVYCGANPGRSAAYADAARGVAAALATAGIRVVYGGGSVGLMGILADAVLAAGGTVTGVIPRHLYRKEVAHENLTELHVVDSMHERKALMAELSDAFIALPGGLGTIEELFEILTWTQLGLHAKPCGLLNVDGYYDRLSDFLDHAVEERFITPQHRGMLLVDDDIERLLARFETWIAPSLPKWIDVEST
jgi:uncharacterized protein (TIGR00730 family)